MVGVEAGPQPESTREGARRTAPLRHHPRRQLDSRPHPDIDREPLRRRLHGDRVPGGDRGHRSDLPGVEPLTRSGRLDRRNEPRRRDDEGRPTGRADRRRFVGTRHQSLRAHCADARSRRARRRTGDAGRGVAAVASQSLVPAPFHPCGFSRAICRDDCCFAASGARHRRAGGRSRRRAHRRASRQLEHRPRSSRRPRRRHRPGGARGQRSRSSLTGGRASRGARRSGRRLHRQPGRRHGIRRWQPVARRDGAGSGDARLRRTPLRGLERLSGLELMGGRRAVRVGREGCRGASPAATRGDRRGVDRPESGEHRDLAPTGDRGARRCLSGHRKRHRWVSSRRDHRHARPARRETPDHGVDPARSVPPQPVHAGLHEGERQPQRLWRHQRDDTHGARRRGLHGHLGGSRRAVRLRRLREGDRRGRRHPDMRDQRGARSEGEARSTCGLHAGGRRAGAGMGAEPLHRGVRRRIVATDPGGQRPHAQRPPAGRHPRPHDEDQDLRVPGRARQRGGARGGRLHPRRRARARPGHRHRVGSA